MINRATYFLFLMMSIISCKRDRSPAELRTGSWRAVLEIQGQELPFNFVVDRKENGGYRAYLRNADERILLDEVMVTSDSVDIGLHVFDANIRAVIRGDSLVGEFVKNPETNYRVPFHAVHGLNWRFRRRDSADVVNFQGKYQVTFVNDRDTMDAVGIFNQFADSVTGTFLTPVGDYRYLEGNVVGGVMHLSTFDGNHAYLFRARKNPDGTLSGEYFSGKTWRQTWKGTKADDPIVPIAESQVTLKPGFETLHFRFPDLEGDSVSLSDDRFEGKVVILQLLGSWCPNCLDETRFLSQWYRENSHRGVEILGLAYEKKADFDYARGRVSKLKERIGVPYDFVIAGISDKEEASKSLPELSAVLAFPTTIFVGRDGKVKGVHSGFSGPGTGEYYHRYIEQFNETVNELLAQSSVLKR